MSEWRDIETAPKDGSYILIADTEHVSMAKYVEDKGERLVANYPTPSWEPFDYSYWDRLESDASWFQPTHWQPLPPLPSPIPSNKRSREMSSETPETIDHTFARIAHMAAIAIRPEVSGDFEYWRIRTAIMRALTESEPRLLTLDSISLSIPSQITEETKNG